jgi:hypothetical protein
MNLHEILRAISNSIPTCSKWRYSCDEMYKSIAAEQNIRRRENVLADIRDTERVARRNSFDFQLVDDGWHDVDPEVSLKAIGQESHPVVVAAGRIDERTHPEPSKKHCKIVTQVPGGPACGTGPRLRFRATPEIPLCDCRKDGEISFHVVPTVGPDPCHGV